MFGYDTHILYMYTHDEKIMLRKKAIRENKNYTFSLKCENCGKEFTLSANALRKNNNYLERILCHGCNISYTKQHFSDEKKEAIRKKTIATCINRYGVTNGGASSISKEKARKTWKENWGSEEECFKKRHEKATQTTLRRYGTLDIVNVPEIKERRDKTIEEKYGSKSAMYEEITRKAVETNKKNHGGKHNLTLKETALAKKEKMGVEYPMQSEVIVKNFIQKYGRIGGTSTQYAFDNKIFDSSWELAYYIWLKDNNIDFEYHPQKYFNYEVNNEIHRYLPDFIVNNIFVEIKGSHLIKNVYSSKVTNHKMKLYEKLEKEGLLKIISDNEITEYLNYVNNTYGKGYMLKFKK